jgi:hypothetical protein
MTSTVDRTTICSPDELAASVPSLVGFYPESSLVIVFSDETSVIVTMRIDLGQPWPDICAAALSAALRVRARTAFVVVYDEVGSELPARLELEGLVEELESHRIEVLELLAIYCGRWWSYRCEAACCPPTGKELDPRLNRIGDGSVSERRSDIARRYSRRPLLTPSMTAVEEVTRALDPNPHERAERAWEALVELHRDPGLGGLDGDAQRALLQVSCLDVRCRDYVLGRICQEEAASPLVGVFVDAALRSHDETLPRMAGAAAALLAATESSSIPAQCLIDLAEDDSLAHLVAASIKAAIPPEMYAQLLRDSLPQTVAALSMAGGRS